MGNILQDVQDYVVGKLSADYQLSGNCTFLAENRKDIEYEIKNKLGRQGICALVMTPKATYAGLSDLARLDAPSTKLSAWFSGQQITAYTDIEVSPEGKIALSDMQYFEY